MKLSLPNITSVGEKRILFGVSLVYVGINIYALSNQNLFAALLPLILGLVFYMILNPVQFWLLMVAATPFSLIVDIPKLESSLALPTEPFIVLFMLLLTLKFLLNSKMEQSILRHPITIIILVHMVWLFITSCFSSIPIVSFKFFISRMWYVVVFYFYGLQVFKQYKNLKRFVLYLSVNLGIIVVYTLIRHSTEFFSHRYSYYAAQPFFKDHNIYAVVVAFLIPPILTMFLYRKNFKLSRLQGVLYGVLSVIYIVGIIMSYTRAAWISLLASLVMVFILMMRVRLWEMMSILATFGLIVLLSWNQIILYLNKNKAESDSDFKAHLQSMYNVTTDDSNTERLNRWSSAFRMFQERPIFGWGPNTYQFQYAPFQLSREKTRISTNSGNLGNSHSEYIGPLAETGLFGALTILLLVYITFQVAMRLYYKSQNRSVRIWAVLVLLAFITYFVHGFLNNYLDIDKANMIFWSFFAVLATIDLRGSEEYFKETST